MCDDVVYWCMLVVIVVCIEVGLVDVVVDEVFGE